MSIEREIDKLRQQLMDEQPFWGILATRLETVICTESLGRAVPTAAVDGKHLFINPEFWNRLSLQERKTIYVHEVGHVGLGHHLRRDGRSQYQWNVSADHEVNLILSQQGFDIPTDSFCDTSFSGWSAERIYPQIPGQSKPPPPGEDPPPPEEDVVIREPEDGPPNEPEPVDEPGDNPAPDQPGGQSGPEGGTVDVPPGEVWDSTNPDGTELTEERKAEELGELSRDIQMAEHARKSAGTGSDAARKRATNRITNPKMKWRNYLSRWIAQRGKPVGRSWSKMDRRSMARGIYQPGEIKDGIDWLVFAIDISSSIADAEFRAFVGHIESIRKNIRIEKITILPFNSTIQQDQIVDLAPRDKFPRELDTGGGTAFAPIFNWVRRQDRIPDGILIFTDLCCDDYGTPARTSILWASTDEIYSSYEGWANNKPPFGDVVQVDISQD